MTVQSVEHMTTFHFRCEERRITKTKTNLSKSQRHHRT